MKMTQFERLAMESLLKEVKRKLWLAQTSMSTKQTTITKRKWQIVVIEKVLEKEKENATL